MSMFSRIKSMHPLTEPRKFCRWGCQTSCCCGEFFHEVKRHKTPQHTWKISDLSLQKTDGHYFHFDHQSQTILREFGTASNLGLGSSPTTNTQGIPGSSWLKGDPSKSTTLKDSLGESKYLPLRWIFFFGSFGVLLMFWKRGVKCLNLNTWLRWHLLMDPCGG